MPFNITASDRTSLIRLASSLPKGSPERRVLLAGLKKVSSYLTPEMEQAALREDAQALAVLLDAKYGEAADIILDDNFGEIRKIFADAGLSLGDFRGKIENALWKTRSLRDDAEIAASPWKTELAVLKSVFTVVVAPKDVRKIKYQPRISKGVIVSAILEDMGGALGNFRTSVTERDASQKGTTLKRVFMCLEDLGAKLVTRGMGPGKPKPRVDYDGWAY